MRISILLAAILCFTTGCTDWEYPQRFPIVLTKEVRNISSGGVVFVGSIESLGSGQNIIAYGFVWSQAELPTLQSSNVIISDPAEKGVFSKKITHDLREDQAYNVRAFIRTDRLTIYGNVVRFTKRSV